MEKLPEEFNMAELLGKAEERTPYQVVALQECERMNFLTKEIRRSLHELNLGLKVRTLLCKHRQSARLQLVQKGILLILSKVSATLQDNNA